MHGQRVVLITGAKGGLGSFVTQAFLAAGDTVAGVSRSISPDDFPNPRFAAMPADLTDLAAARRLAEQVVRRFRRVDALIHVMGGFAGGQPIPETGDDIWERMLSLNLRAAVNTFRAVIPHMRAAGGGRIVAVASRAAVEPAANIAAYAASKAALLSLVRSAALENQDAGITANTILPGTMNTEANRKADPRADASRWVPPEDVAQLAVFLVSDAAAQITGAAIPVYGREA
ncbi:MAG TPA: SDR family NAD(P)-dependent oxidoreductase [Bryobacteraceae bacterium]|nr:SDR family NAD(P)-dependent oxidoreductase [Bryobacteraceae bacterium]